jgi:hypoxanthine phosphoribosyltransferase
MDWSEYGKHLLRLSEKVEAGEKMDAHTIDCVVGIPRGGDIVAVCLPHSLMLPFENLPKDQQAMPVFFETLSGKSILLCDDISDKGDTLRGFVELLSQFVKEIRTATIAINKHTALMPNYYCFSTDCWIVFPYERKDALHKRDCDLHGNDSS